jgi:flagellin
MSNLVVQTNVLALNSHRNLKAVGTKQAQSAARLSSGYRINSAADDAAGLAISEKMRAQIRGLDMASKNSQDGISLVQTAEGGMQEIDNMVQRIRELAVQASNDTNDSKTNDRKKIQDEIDQLTKGIDKMVDQVEFNNKKLLDGSLLDGGSKADILAQVNQRILTIIGSSQTSMLSVNSGAMAAIFSTLTDAAALGAVAATTGWVNNGVQGSYSFEIDAVAVVAQVASANIESFAAAETYIGLIDTYIAGLTLHTNNGDPSGDAAARLSSANAMKDAVMKAVSLVQVATAQTQVRTTVNGITGQGLWFQTGANSAQGMQVGIGSLKSDSLGIGDGQGGSAINVNRAKGQEISSFIDRVNDALSYVTSERAKMGAVQNRLEFTKSSLDISSENLSAAESRIRDTDMAKEMMKSTSANVLQQAGVAMLTQANQAPQSVLQLLR